LAKTLADFLEGCDMAGFNSSRFDVPMLAEEFLRAGVEFDISKRKFVDVQIIFHKKEQRTLEAAYRFYCDKELDNAHSAEADAVATYEVLKSQLERYPDLVNDINVLSKEFSSFNDNVDFAGRIVLNEKGVEVFNFGKHKGKAVAEVFKKEPSYYAWMMEGDFPLNTKQVITKIRLREMNK
jgi:DNA polymerase-3 subunit epsilon